MSARDFTDFAIPGIHMQTFKNVPPKGLTSAIFANSIQVDAEEEDGVYKPVKVHAPNSIKDIGVIETIEGIRGRSSKDFAHAVAAIVVAADMADTHKQWVVVRHPDRKPGLETVVVAHLVTPPQRTM